ncbi:MAG: ATP-binding protein [Tessaracoccus sp.]
MVLLSRGLLDVGADALGTFPVVVVQGARQVGKSTLAAMLVQGREARQVTLDDLAVRGAAEEDPVGFVEQFPDGTLVIDEVQLQPALLRTIKASVDRNRVPGRFLLTGSANLLRVKGETDSLAGRAVSLRLRGLSQGEIQGRRDDFVARVLGAAENVDRVSTQWARPEYVRAFATGGFPEALKVEGRMRSLLLDGYLERILERDAPSLPGGGQAARIRSVATLLASNQAGELVKARLADQSAIPQNSIGTYLDALEATYLIDLLKPWGANLTKREIGRPKVLVSDSALAMRLTRTTSQQLESLTSTRIGGISEAFVAGELLKQQGWSDVEFEVFHYRDRDGVEVDLIVELDDGRVLAIEVKSSVTYKPEHFKGLRFVRDRLGDRFAGGIVLGMAAEGLRFGDRLWGMPISALWEL